MIDLQVMATARSNGWTALHYAALSGQYTTVLELISAGSDCDARGKEGSAGCRDQSVAAAILYCCPPAAKRLIERCLRIMVSLLTLCAGNEGRTAREITVSTRLNDWERVAAKLSFIDDDRAGGHAHRLSNHDSGCGGEHHHSFQALSLSLSVHSARPSEC